MPRHFDDWLKAYMHYTRDSESPDVFHFWTGVSTIAGALRRRVWIDQRKWQWTPNFYIIIVGPPGVAAKSTSMRNGQRLLEKVEGVKFGPQSMTWQKLSECLMNSMEYFKYSDPHAEEGISEMPMSAVTVSIGELGTFLKMEDSALVDVLISLWDGQLETWGHHTRSNGAIDIKNPWLNIIGCTTPSWLRNNFPMHMIDGGLTSRILFVYGDRKRQLVPYPDEVIPDAEYQEHEKKLIEDLQQIGSMVGPYVLTEGARRWGRDWYEKMWSSRPLDMASERWDGYRARKQTHMHKLAMVLAAAKRNELYLEAEDLEAADMLLGTVEKDMFKVFESIGVVDQAKYTSELVSIVRVHKFVTSEQLWRMVMNIMSMDDFKKAVIAAVEGGVLKKVTLNGKLGVTLGHEATPPSAAAPDQKK